MEALQNFLIKKNLGSAAEKLAAERRGSETFGELTKEALIEYQKHYNITPAEGYFGPLTRKSVQNRSGL